MRYIVPIGRIFFSLMFIMAGFMNFSKTIIGYAASQGVPLASLAVPLSGLIALAVKTAICARVTRSDGLKVVAVKPEVMPFANNGVI